MSQQYNIPPNAVSERHFDGNVQHRYLDFIMENPGLLSSVNRSGDGMITIRKAFEEDFRRRGFAPPFVEIAQIFILKFRPIIGSDLGRLDKDTRKTEEIKATCPFLFCGNGFTRSAGLKR